MPVFLQTDYRNSPAYGKVTFRKVRPIPILRDSNLSINMVKCVCEHKGIQNPVKIRTQRTGIWPAAARLPRCRCYRPAVFFCHLRLIALSLSQEKIL